MKSKKRISKPPIPPQGRTLYTERIKRPIFPEREIKDKQFDIRSFFVGLFTGISITLLILDFILNY